MELVPQNVLSFFSDSQVENIKSLGASSESKTFLVELKTTSYVLKCFSPDVAISVVPLNEEVTQFLFVNGFEKISRKFLGQNDSTHFESEDGSCWTAQEYIEADQNFDWRECSWTVDHAREAGQVLAWMHLRGVYVEHDLELYQINSAILSKSKISEEFIKERAVNALTSIQSQISSLTNIMQPSELEKHISNLFEELSESTGDLSKFGTMENWLFSAMVLNHGDYHPGNILYKDDVAKAIIDFDYANFNTPAIELGYALFMFANKSKYASSVDASIAKEACSTEMARAFLDGYFHTVRKMESIQNYTFESAFRVLRSRMKLAAVYTLFWVNEQLNRSLAISSESKLDENQAKEVLTCNQEKLDQIAMFCLSSIC